MLRLSRELLNRGFDSRQELLDLLMQIDLMEAYATLQGKPIDKTIAVNLAELANLIKRSPDASKPGEILKDMTDESVMKALTLAFDVHGSLSELVKPATPESLEASAPRQGWARIIWPRVTDILIATTFVAVAACAIGFGLKTQVTDPKLQLAYQELAYLGAALLGASFTGLFTAYKYVQERTFDPASGSSYMVRVVLGTVSGLILANIGSQILKNTGQDPNSVVGALGPGSLALIGGYSADAVNMILQRIADTVVTTVRGNADDAIKAKQAQLAAESKSSEFQQRQATVLALSDVLANVSDSGVRDKLKTVMSSVAQGTIGDLKAQPAQGNGKILNMAAVTPINQLPVTPSIVAAVSAEPAKTPVTPQPPVVTVANTEPQGNVGALDQPGEPVTKAANNDS